MKIKISEKPIISRITPVRDGYMARSLCLVDGFPAEVRLNVNTEHQRYSEYWIDVWSPRQMRWALRVITLAFDDVGHMPPLLIGEAEARATLALLAEQLWHDANTIVQLGRERQEDVDAATFLHEQMSLDRARPAAAPLPIVVHDAEPVYRFDDQGTLVPDRPELRADNDDDTVTWTPAREDQESEATA